MAPLPTLLPPVARVLPSVLSTTMFIPPGCWKLALALPVCTSQSVTRPAALAPTRVLSSAENWTRSTPPCRPDGTTVALNVRVSQSFTTPARLVVARVLPSWLNSSATTSPLCPESIARSWPSSRLQTFASTVGGASGWRWGAGLLCAVGLATGAGRACAAGLAAGAGWGRAPASRP